MVYEIAGDPADTPPPPPPLVKGVGIKGLAKEMVDQTSLDILKIVIRLNDHK